MNQHYSSVGSSTSTLRTSYHFAPTSGAMGNYVTHIHTPEVCAISKWHDKGVASLTMHNRNMLERLYRHIQSVSGVIED